MHATTCKTHVQQRLFPIDRNSCAHRQRCVFGIVLALLSVLVPTGMTPAIDITIQYINRGENPSNDANGAWLNFIFNAAANIWENYLPDSGSYTFDVSWSNSHFADSPNALGEYVPDCCGPDNIYIRSTPMSPWFFDSSPLDNSEYDFDTQVRVPKNGSVGEWVYVGGQWLYGDVDNGEQMDWFDGNVPGLLEIGFRGQAINPLAVGRFDLLSTVIHEMGHALGVNSSGGPWQPRSQWVNGASDVVFVEDTEGGHLAARTSLMCEGCGLVGTRRLPSAMDIMAVADDEGFANVDLPRKDFAKSGGNFDWNTAANWMGGRVPDSDDWVYLRSGANVSLSANATANRLSIRAGNSLNTQSRALTVGDTLAIAGHTFSKGTLTVGSNGSVSAEHMNVNGNLVVEGGTVTAGTDLVINSSGTLRGRGTISAATLTNNGAIRAQGGTLTIGDLVTANFGGENGQGILDASVGSLHLTALLTPEFQGRAMIGSGQSIHQAVNWTLGQQGELNFLDGASAATLSGAQATIRGKMTTAAVGTITAPVQVESTADIQVASNARLRLVGNTTFRGGSFTGPGSLIQRGNLTVAANTQLDVGTFDWDGDNEFSPSTTTIATGKTFRINALRIEPTSNPNDGFDGIVNVNGGILQVDTHGPQFAVPWRMEGTMNLAGTAQQPAWVKGSTMIVGDPGIVGLPGAANLNISPGMAVIEAPVIVEPSAYVSVPANATLYLANTTTFQGGNHAGDGTVSQYGNAIVQANTTIGYRRYYMDGAVQSTTTVQPGANFVVDARQISESADNVFDGTMVVNGGTLDMRTHNVIVTLNGPIRVATPWRMAGTMHLNAVGNQMPKVTGSRFTIGETNLSQPAALVTIDGAATFDVPQVTMESNAIVEFDVRGKATGQFDRLNVTGTMGLDGMLDVLVNRGGGSYLDPTVTGTYDAFGLITASGISGTFDHVRYQGTLLSPTFASASFMRSYQGNGLFRNVDYHATDVTLTNYRAMPGDANGDGVVDGSDFGIWNANKFRSGTDWTTGDFNGDGFTDGSDFGIWNAHKFASAIQAAAIPEPSTWLMFATIVLAFHQRRQIRGRH